MSDPCRNCRLFSHTQKAVKSPQHELGMTPIAESLAGSSGGQLRFIKQLILLTDNSPLSHPPNFNSCKALRSSCLFIFWEWHYSLSSTPSKKQNTTKHTSTYWKPAKKKIKKKWRDLVQFLELIPNNNVFVLWQIVFNHHPHQPPCIQQLCYFQCSRCSALPSSNTPDLPVPFSALSPMTALGTHKELLL